MTCQHLNTDASGGVVLCIGCREPITEPEHNVGLCLEIARELATPYEPYDGSRDDALVAQGFTIGRKDAP